MRGFGKLWKNRKLLLQVFEILRDVADGVYTLAMFRQRLGERVQKGDLDDVLQTFMDAEAAAEDYIRKG